MIPIAFQLPTCLIRPFLALAYSLAQFANPIFSDHGDDGDGRSTSTTAQMFCSLTKSSILSKGTRPEVHLR